VVSSTTDRDMRAVLDAVRQIVRALRAGAGAAPRRAGVTTAQLFALQQIAEHPGASVNDVAALTFTHQSSVSVVIQRLVASRLVVKVPAAQDRRRQHLAPTAAGRRILGQAPVVVQQRLVAAIASLRRADQKTLARLLGEVAALMAPAGATRHPPMLFEEHNRRAPGTGRRVRRGPIAGRRRRR
jgi:DNA-binding MarR family transcriptional regulator